jgi:hypothetical protein
VPRKEEMAQPSAAECEHERPRAYRMMGAEKGEEEEEEEEEEEGRREGEGGRVVEVVLRCV